MSARTGKLQVTEIAAGSGEQARGVGAVRIIDAQLFARGLLGVEAAAVLLVAALFLFPLVERAMKRKREVVVQIATVEMPEHRPRHVSDHLAQRAIACKRRPGVP